MSINEESLSSSDYESTDEGRDHDQDQDQVTEEGQAIEVADVSDDDDDEQTPSIITFDSPVVSLEFHNSSDKIACGLMDGVVTL